MASRDQKLRVGLMGTPDFAVPAFQAIIDAGYDVVCVYSQPPRPKGRGHKVQKSPVHLLGEAHDIPVFHPINFKDAQDVNVFQSHDLDIAIVAAYGLILPEVILNAPKYGCVNLHGSLLPRWRGASPIQHAIWKGDNVSGMTLMQMDRGLDTGDMIAKYEIPLTSKTTSAALHDNLAQMGADMIVMFLDDLRSGKDIAKTPQNNAESVYAPLLRKRDGVIDWAVHAEKIDCQVRALNPWPGVVTTLNGKRIKVLETVFGSQNHAHRFGVFDAENGRVFCGDHSYLTLIRVQPEGKTSMGIQDAVNGGYLRDGDVLGT